MSVTYPLWYKGKVYRIPDNPFEPYMGKNGLSGYCGKWLITDVRLFLIGLYRRYCDEDDIENGYKNLVQIFPDSHCPFVLADWYSGRLSVEDEIEDDTFEIEFTLDEGYVINSERRYVGPALPF